ncbi:MAG: heme-binding protein [Geminicoccaceae bacterium]|nr:MAG: heme-binding protein [Geminicoccaceae bacterium]
MRQRLLVISVALLLAGCTAFGVRSGTEEPPFEVLAALDGSTEIRRYGPRLAAETAVAAEPGARNAAFRVLAGYIFGGNQGERRIAMTVPVETQEPGQRIAMTVPVEVDEATGELRMRFFLPSEFTLDTAPLPNDPRVTLVELEPTTVAVRRFTGSTANTAVALETTALLAALDGSPWVALGEPVAYFYDPPWTLPPARRNEVVVPVTRRDES